MTTLSTKTWKYSVVFTLGTRWKDDASYETARVVVIDGYTTIGDIPKILSIPRGCSPEDITVVSMHLTGTTD